MYADPKLVPAQSSLIEKHLPIARQIAARLKSHYAWVPCDDLYSYALSGLTMAAQSFEPNRGVPFSYYAYRIGTYSAIDQMRQDGVMHRANLKPQPKFISLVEDSGGYYQSTSDLPDKHSDDNQQFVEMRDLVTHLLHHLKEDDRKLLLMYYADNMKFREIAKVFSVSESCICLRHQAIIEKLRRLAVAT